MVFLSLLPLLQAGQPHPLQRCDFFSSYYLSCEQANHILYDVFFSSRDWRSTQSLIIYVPIMYPLVYLAEVFCLSPVHKYILCFTDSFVRRSFLNFWIGIANIFSRTLFPQFLFTIFCTWVLVRISDMSQERGSGHCILDQIQTRMFCPSILPGWVPYSSKTVSTRAHICKVQAYLHGTTLQVKLCS